MEIRKSWGAAQTVYGDPYDTADGSTIVPVIKMRGENTAPVGVFVVSGGEVTWSPVVDVTKIALMGEFIGLATGVIATLAMLRRPPWPDLRYNSPPAWLRR